IAHVVGPAPHLLGRNNFLYLRFAIYDLRVSWLRMSAELGEAIKLSEPGRTSPCRAKGPNPWNGVPAKSQECFETTSPCPHPKLNSRGNRKSQIVNRERPSFLKPITGLEAASTGLLLRMRSGALKQATFGPHDAQRNRQMGKSLE